MSSSNEKLYQKFKELYSEDVMNIDKKSLLTRFLNAINERKQIIINMKTVSSTDYIYVKYKNNKIKISNLSRITLKEYILDDEFYNVYLRKLFDILN